MNFEARFNEITQQHVALHTKFNRLAKHYDSLEDCNFITGPKKSMMTEMHAVAHQLQALSVEQNALLQLMHPSIAA